MFYLVIVVASVGPVLLHPTVFTIYAVSTEQAVELALSDFTDPSMTIEKVRVFSTSLCEPTEEVV